jgi:hypothetical protein
VVRQNEGEENFHIFSYLFAGAHQADPNGNFALQDPATYRSAQDFNFIFFLNTPDCVFWGKKTPENCRTVIAVK